MFKNIQLQVSASSSLRRATLGVLVALSILLTTTWSEAEVSVIPRPPSVLLQVSVQCNGAGQKGARCRGIARLPEFVDAAREYQAFIAELNPRCPRPLKRQTIPRKNLCGRSIATGPISKTSPLRFKYVRKFKGRPVVEGIAAPVNYLPLD